MPEPALKAFNELIFCLHNRENIEDIEGYMAELVSDFHSEYEAHITQWASNYHKIRGRDTTCADTLFFKERRLVIAYKYLHDDARYIHIIAALMKDLPKPNLSIRKAIFLYDADLQKIIQIENEIPEI